MDLGDNSFCPWTKNLNRPYYENLRFICLFLYSVHFLVKYLKILYQPTFLAQVTYMFLNALFIYSYSYWTLLRLIIFIKHDKAGHGLKLKTIRPCQIGILLSVRMRVGFRVLSPIKKHHKFVGEISLYNSDVPRFRKNITIL